MCEWVGLSNSVLIAVQIGFLHSNKLSVSLQEVRKMSERFWLLLLGAVVVILLLMSVWFFWPRPIRSAGEMPSSPHEKAQRWQKAMEKAFGKVTIPQSK
jgi:type VI protein secretion system component VasK